MSRTIPVPLPFLYDDGGARAAGFVAGPQARDCVCRSIAIATGVPYSIVYGRLVELAKHERGGLRWRSHPGKGVHRVTWERLLCDELGWTWHSTVRIDSGCTARLAAGELPAGRIVARVFGHVTCVIGGVVHDTVDPSRGGIRSVYGYYAKG